MDFPQLTMTLPDGREESIMKRTTLARPHPRFNVSRQRVGADHGAAGRARGEHHEAHHAGAAPLQFNVS